jgi:4-amino-4-deoxy-L-arabinose transferase-like glycosyltransferase
MSFPEGIAATPPRAARRTQTHPLAFARIWPEALALALLAGLLNFWDLARNGWANTYYGAAVRSMSASWHNFLFASFDPSGVMTVDKPPLALWIETASAKLFGFHPVAILAPQALMGVASVLLVYDLTRRRFGRSAGFVAGLALALTPIAVAISRHDNPDALLVLCSVAALWCALRALEGGRTRWFVLAGVCVGLGFETKMLVALVVVPGIAAAWARGRSPRGEVDGSPLAATGGIDGSPLAATPRRARVRTRTHARRGPFTNTLAALARPLAGGAALLLVGGAWPLLVELTPASDRPWISGTADNTIRSLIFGYNGLGRIDGQSGGPQALGGSNVFGGSTGPLRLLNEALGGQAGWLLGFALLSAVSIAIACRLRRADPRSGWLLAVGGAFLTTAVLFSFAGGIFHPYYVSLLAPFGAALVGAGFAQMRRDGTHVRVLAALAIAAGVATELVVLHDYPAELRWLTPTLIAAGALAAALLLVGGARLRLAALAGALGLLLVAPATWAVQTLGHATSGTFPAGGPADSPASGLGGPANGARGAFPGARSGGFPGAQPSAGGSPPGTAQGAPAGAPPALFGGRSSSAPPPSPEAGAAVAGGPEAAATASAGDTRRAAPPAGRSATLGSGVGRSFAPGAAGHSGAGGPFGGTSRSLTVAVRYAAAHGGGTVAVASQSEAAPLVIDGARVAGIGGFSGRESETNAAWLAQEVRAGHIRWVLTSSGRPSAGGPGDRRVGSTRAMAAVARTCRRASGVSGLYDCAGRAAQLADA